MLAKEHLAEEKKDSNTSGHFGFSKDVQKELEDSLTYVVIQYSTCIVISLERPLFQLLLLSVRLKLNDLKVAAEEGEDPIALHEHEPSSIEGDGLRDGTVTPETPVKDTPPVVVVAPQAAEGTSATTARGRRAGTHDITAMSPKRSGDHPITVTPPTPGMLFAL